MSVDTIIAIIVSFITTSLLGGFMWYAKKMLKQLKAAQGGMKAILYDSIVRTYNKYKDRGYLPIYERKTLDEVHGAYKEMGGNGTATHLYNKMMSWPTDATEEGGINI